MKCRLTRETSFVQLTSNDLKKLPAVHTHLHKGKPVKSIFILLLAAVIVAFCMPTVAAANDSGEKVFVCHITGLDIASNPDRFEGVVLWVDTGSICNHCNHGIKFGEGSGAEKVIIPDHRPNAVYNNPPWECESVGVPPDGYLGYLDGDFEWQKCVKEYVEGQTCSRAINNTNAVVWLCDRYCFD
jgi:hypothetical protein